MDDYKKLEDLFVRLSHIDHAIAILSWDEATTLSSAGGKTRANALSELGAIYHETLVHPQTSEWLNGAEPIDTWQKINLIHMKKIQAKAACIPAELNRELTYQKLLCEQVWRTTKPCGDWHTFAPHLEKVVHLCRESSQIQGSVLSLDPYDVMIDHFSPGLSQKAIDPLFDVLAQELPLLLEQVLSTQAPFSSMESQIPITQQKKVAKIIMRHLGFSFEHGRLDTSTHPFCGGVYDDVRITTRYDIRNFMSSLMGVCHETGHAIYERQRPEPWRHQPVGQPMGTTIHESQSLLFEMQLCRSEAFIKFLTPILQTAFSSPGSPSYEQLLAYHRQVTPGPIRVDADELTYPLHIILRYQLEKALIKGSISVQELPDAWHDYMSTQLGVDINGNHAIGVMQDIHWSSGCFGYFPSYTLGAMFAADQFELISRQLPQLQEEVARGDFSSINAWLKEYIHQWGSYHDTLTLMQQVSGHHLNASCFLKHLRRRYLS